MRTAGRTRALWLASRAVSHSRRDELANTLLPRGALVIGVDGGVGAEHRRVEVGRRRGDALVGDGPHEARRLRLRLVGVAADAVHDLARGRRERERRALGRRRLHALLVIPSTQFSTELTNVPIAKS